MRSSLTSLADAPDAAWAGAEDGHRPRHRGTYLLDASTGGVVRFLPGGTQFAQPTFAGRYLFTAAQTGGVLTAWKLP